MGADVDIAHGLVIAEAEKLNGTHIYLDKVSVGATINIMMAASMAEGSRDGIESRCQDRRCQ